MDTEASELESLKPGTLAQHRARQRLTLKAELILALLPTVTILLVMALVESLTSHRLLFASLASSAFLIYLDPQHGTNSTRSLVISQVMAALIGAVAFYALGPIYTAAALSMVATIVLMITLDAVHPPAVATALSFALRTGQESNLVLFGSAVGMMTMLIIVQRVTLRLFARYAHQHDAHQNV